MIDETISNFANTLMIEDISLHTQRAYVSESRRFLEWCTEGGQPKLASVLELEPIHFQNYFEHRHSSLMQSSQQRSIAALRRFVQFLELDDGHLLPRHMRPRSGERSLPREIDTELLIRALDASSAATLHSRSFTKIRDHAVVELLYSSGLRAEELVSLDYDELVGALGNAVDSLDIIGKGRRKRRIYIGKGARSALEFWFATRKGAVAVTGDVAAFVNRSGRRLTTRTLQRIVNGWGATFGIDHLTPHSLRHCFATDMLNACQNLSVVQEMLGHSNPQTTQIYTRISDHYARQQFEATHPRARKTS